MKSGATDRALYFAYGSNLLSERMRSRVASARAVCAAWVDGHRLCCGKLGRDGTGKATLVKDDSARVWGALYSVAVTDWQVLDGFEPGYARITLAVTTVRRESLLATAYLAPVTADAPVPLASYKQIIVAGAREHGLPAEYIASLLSLPEQPDTTD